MTIWTVYIRHLTARSVQSDLDLHCSQNLTLTLSLSARKELKANVPWTSSDKNNVNISGNHQTRYVLEWREK